MTAIEVFYYTDPCRPWSWALEPAVRRLAYEFGEALKFTCVMSGIAREFGPAEAPAHPASFIPTYIGVKAAAGRAGTWSSAARTKNLLNTPNPWVDFAFGKLSTV
jgi:hypothetical protein